MIRALQILYWRWREAVLEAQVANGEALLRDHRQRLEACQGQLSIVQRRLNIARLTGNARPLILEALNRRNSA